ncbi:zinc-dependent alcohol dehydrogenase family protein [Halosimplex halophilum]|uniref:zinc-dependent alcohol dehydrogenase family protein n=1 Tax=Halosimplex halophilum TaxID=2559572 RepID=UPI00107F6EDC|nr:zinc-dependent alcohol dehydrogenase family protein [Halosimplex halophilum]
MRAAIYHGERDVRVEDVDRPEIESPGDALVRVTHTAICGSDLWPYRGRSDRDTPSRIGHEPMGIVEEVGDDVRSVQPGDRVFAPFVVSCGECEFCRRGLHTSCVNGDGWGGDNGGAQGEYVRAPHADGTLVRIPDRYADDEDALQAALPLTDVMGTGHHAAVSAGVEAGDTCVVVGDGAVGLCGVLAARRLGASRIVAVGHHADRLDLAEEFGATDTVLGGEGGVDDEAERVRELTHGGAEHVLECVGAAGAMGTAVGAARPGGTVGYVGVPHGMGDGLDLFPFFGDNVTLSGGVAPVRAYADELLADVLGGTLDPSPIFTKTVSLDDIAEGYRAMDEREAIKVLVKP